MREPGTTPTLTEIIEEIVEDRLFDLNTAFPARIVRVDKAKGLLDVQSDWKRVYEDQDEPVTPPVIKGVPLWQYRAGGARMNFPVQVGHRVLVVCCQRSLDRWKRAGTLDTPGSSSIHSINGAVAIPGLYPVSEVFPIDDNLVLRFGSAIMTLIENQEIKLEVTSAKFRATQDGKFSLGNGTVELIDRVIAGLEAQNATIDLILAMTFPTSFGPTGTVIQATLFQQQKQANQRLINELTQLKLGG